MKRENLRIQEKEMIKQRVKIKDAFNNIYKTEDGKIVIHAITKKCLEGLGEGTVNLAFNAGKHNIFMYIMDMLYTDKDIFLHHFIKKEMAPWKSLMEQWIQSEQKDYWV